ncbi:MAG: PrsW family intramembrane metalloprotease [Lachnospiraceae bacterium]|nr:PrsW family intramembrane metalloprotease [Lachnospiraceae bacterium]
MFCSNCGKEVPEGASFCTSCGAKLGRAGFGIGSQAVSDLGGMALTAAGAFRKNLTGYEHGEKVHIQYRELFSSVFKKHSREEEDLLVICGTSQTTPNIRDIVAEWPRPWLFSRVFLFLLAASLILALLLLEMNGIVTAPALFLILSAVGPLSVLVFFFETNIPRDISIYRVAKVFILGGALSILFSFAISEIVHQDFTLIGAIGIGFTEELGKALAALLYLNGIQKQKGRLYIVNGLLVGSAVGAGFAVFESAGYAFVTYLETYMGALYNNSSWFSDYLAPDTISADASFSVAIIRALLSPGGHVIWCAIISAGLCIASKGAKIEPKHLVSPQFLGIFIIPTVLHAMWDWETLFDNLGYLSYVLLTVIAWLVGLVLLHRGIREINQAVEDVSSA